MHRHRYFILWNLIWIRILQKLSILHLDDSCRILISQFRVMGNHDNQSVLGHFFQQIHYLNTCLTIQGTCRFIRQKDIRVIHQGTGQRYTLHLTTGHLIRLLMDLIPQTYFFQRLNGTLPTFLS